MEDPVQQVVWQIAGRLLILPLLAIAMWLTGLFAHAAFKLLFRSRQKQHWTLRTTMAVGVVLLVLLWALFSIAYS
jgi:hypothetical protein